MVPCLVTLCIFLTLSCCSVPVIQILHHEEFEMWNKKDQISNMITIVININYVVSTNFTTSLLRTYSHPPYTDVIGCIIVIWNNANTDVPQELLTQQNLIIIRAENSSLNNRWILPVPLIETEAVLMHDHDDMAVNYDGIKCMFEVWKRNKERLITNFVHNVVFDANSTISVRYVDNAKGAYSLGSRLVLISTKYLHVYNNSILSEMMHFISNGPFICDDIAFNMIISLYSRLPPLQVNIPQDSILCGKQFQGNIYLPDWQRNRTLCVQSLLKYFPDSTKVLIPTNEIAVCPSINSFDLRRENNRLRRQLFKSVWKSCQKPSVKLVMSNDVEHLHKKDYITDRITVVVNLHSLNRFDISSSVLKAYSHPPYTEIIASIIVVWNNIHSSIPSELLSLNNLIVIRGEIESTCNRYILPVPLIETEALVMHDVDLLLTFEAFKCMHEVWKQNRNKVVSNFVHHVIDIDPFDMKYVDRPKEVYSVATRLMMVSAKFLSIFKATLDTDALEYIDNCPVACDDIAFNMVASHYSRLPPLRVNLPHESIVCGKEKSYSSDWVRNRSICTKALLQLFPDSSNLLVSSKEVAACPVTNKTLMTNNLFDSQSFLKSVRTKCKGPTIRAMKKSDLKLLNAKEYNADKITLIVTLYSLNRMDFSVSVLKAYSQPPYTDLIREIIVIWNNLYMTIPQELQSLKNVVIILGKINSLNNRWILPIPFIKTESIIMHDDDMLVTFDGFKCMFEVWKQNKERVLSHFVRHALDVNTSDVKYVFDELESTNVTYSMAIRLIMVSTKYLRMYNESMEADMLDYITYGPGKCDDIAFNMVSSFYSRLPPLRVMLPPKSVFSYESCGREYEGIGFGPDRQRIRSVCTQALLQFFPDPGGVLVPTNDLGYCPAIDPIKSYEIYDASQSQLYFENIRINCNEEEIPKFLNTQYIEYSFGSEVTPYVNLVPISTILQSTCKSSFRLGIIAMEFWSIELDGRKGGFGYAALMASQAFMKSPSSSISVYFLHASKYYNEKYYSCDDNLLELHSRPLVLLRHQLCYKSIIDRLRLDAVITIEFRKQYMNVLKFLPHTPVIIWVHDPHSPEIYHKLRHNKIPALDGKVMPIDVSPSNGLVGLELKRHTKVIFATTIASFVTIYPSAYGFLPLRDYVTPQLPYAMDAFDGTEEAPLPSNPHITPRVVFVGRMDPVKRPWLFAEAARRLPHVEFILLGRLFATANSIGFGFSEETKQPANLRLVGHLEGQEKKKMIASAWILVSTTIHEGFPFNFIEALQSGIPLVATHDPEGITSKFGIFVGNHPNNSGFSAIPLLVNAIDDLIKNETHRRQLGNAGKSWVASTLSTKNFITHFDIIRKQIRQNKFSPLNKTMVVDNLRSDTKINKPIFDFA